MTETRTRGDRPPEGEAGGEARSVSALFESIIGHVEEILRSEVRLVRAEIRQEIRQLSGSGTYVLVGGVTAVFAAAFLLLGAVYALSSVLPPWASAFAVGLLLAAASAICFMMGRRRFRQFHLRPERTIESVKENVSWIRKRAG